MVSTKQIPNSRDQSDALTVIVVAISKLSQSEVAAELLKQAITSAHQIPNSRARANALTAIAEVYTKLENGRKIKSE